MSVCCRVERFNIARTQSDQHWNSRLKEGIEAEKHDEQVRTSTVKIGDIGNGFLMSMLCHADLFGSRFVKDERLAETF